MIYYSTCWNDKHTSHGGLSVTHSHRHDGDVIAIAWRFSTLERGTQLFSLTYIDHSIFSNSSFCVFALLFFLVHTGYGTWEKRGSSRKHKHPF